MKNLLLKFMFFIISILLIQYNMLMSRPLRKKQRKINNLTNTKFSICRNSLLPLPSHLNMLCEKINYNQKENLNKRTGISLILNISKISFHSFICQMFSELFWKFKLTCKLPCRGNRIDNDDSTLLYNKFIRILNKYNSDTIKKKTNKHRILVLNVDTEYLEFAYYFLDVAREKNIIPEFTNFDLIIFQTEYHKFLYKIRNTNKYTYRLNFHTKRTNDLHYKVNLNYRHENNLYRKNSLLNSFRHLKNKFQQCKIYKLIYTYYLKNLRLRKGFFYYYIPIIDLGVTNSQLNRVEMKFDDFKLWYTPNNFIVNQSTNKNLNTRSIGIKNETSRPVTINSFLNLLKNSAKKNKFSSFIQFDSSSSTHVPHDDIFYSNRKNFRNERIFLDASLNEKAKGKKKHSNSNFSDNNDTFINLYNKSKSDLDEKGTGIDFLIDDRISVIKNENDFEI